MSISATEIASPSATLPDMSAPADLGDPESQTAQLPSADLSARSYATRLEFLYNIVEDTQDTIRFIDTKAAFCVTLSSGMVAAAIQSGHTGVGRGDLGRVIFLVFLAAIILTLLVCLRVIFPTIKPHTSHATRVAPSNAVVDMPDPKAKRHGPKFFIGHNKRHHWLLHTVRNTIEPDILSESHDSYVEAVTVATDADLVHSMCEEVLMISLIRQIKTDRLHTAMFSLMAAIAAFCILMAG